MIIKQPQVTAKASYYATPVEDGFVQQADSAERATGFIVLGGLAGARRLIFVVGQKVPRRLYAIHVGNTRLNF